MINMGEVAGSRKNELMKKEIEKRLISGRSERNKTK
jgi:hypothetical protein